MERTPYQKAMDSFSLKMSVMVETVKAHGHRVDELITCGLNADSDKFTADAESLHSQWLFIEYRAEQLERQLAENEGDWPLCEVETLHCDLGAFYWAGEGIVGEAFEAFGRERPYIQTVLACYCMVKFSGGLHDELGRIIADAIANRRQPNNVEALAIPARRARVDRSGDTPDQAG